MKLGTVLSFLIGLAHYTQCYPTESWYTNPCSRNKVIELQPLQGQINSDDVELNITDDCQVWLIRGVPSKTITIRFSDFHSGAFSCNEGAYVELGPAPKSTLCGVPKLPFTYHSTADQAWIKFVIPRTMLAYKASFIADYISELGVSCTARCNDGTCIYSQWRCNGNIECLDSSDEMNCRTRSTTKKAVVSTTTSSTRNSSGIAKSPAVQPKYGCGYGDLHCLSKYFVYACIPQNKICDGEGDCLNGKDEDNCEQNEMSEITTTVPVKNPCGYGEIYCQIQGTDDIYQCLHNVHKCDGTPDCKNNEDEHPSICSTSKRNEMTTTVPVKNPCGYGEIYCKIQGMGDIYQCLHNIHKCDGIPDCRNKEDEDPSICRDEECNRRLEEPSGWFAPPSWSNHCSWVIHQQGSSPESKIQIRTVFFALPNVLAGLEYVKIYDGPDATYPLIGRYDGLNPPPQLIESSSNWLHVTYQSVEQKNNMAFNFTYQTKGFCLPGQIKCLEENDCYEMSKRCNGVWDCPVSGSDELGCGRCFSTDYYCGSQTGQCYHKEERCNGITRCSSKVDEINCTSVQCGSHNGTFLCDNSHCIYESWLCDQRDDCGDNSDERRCGGSTKRVIIAAISGSMICALLLVILMGCSCKLYSLRVVDHRRMPRHETPMSRLYAEFLRRRAPPPYHEAMLTSRNFDEVQQEFLDRVRQASNRSRRGRRSRSRNNHQNQAGQDGDTNNNNEQAVGNQDGGNGNGENGNNDGNDGQVEPGVSNSVNSNNPTTERQSSTAELLPSDSQTGSSDSDDSDISDNDSDDNGITETNLEGQTEDRSDEENILASQSLSTRWARATETETMSDEECILDNVSESQSIDNTAEPLTFSSSFCNSHCDNASLDTGSLSVNSIELPEITHSTVGQEDSANENDSDFDKLEDEDSPNPSPKPEERSMISDQRCISHDSLDSVGSEIASDNDVPLLSLNHSLR